MFLPKHEIIDKERATAQMIAHQNARACRFERMENVHGKLAHTLLIETLYGQRQTCARAILNFKSNGSRRISAILFNRHVIYDW
jgi:hypothetical protein